MKQVQQNYRSGELKVAEVPGSAHGRLAKVLVATRVSLISSGTEKQLMDLAKASLRARRWRGRTSCAASSRNVQRDGLKPTHGKGLRQARYADSARLQPGGEVIAIGRNGGGLSPWATASRAPARASPITPRSTPCPRTSACRPRRRRRRGRELRHTRRHRAAGRAAGRADARRDASSSWASGLIGLLTVQILKANGCRVIGFDPNPATRRRSRRARRRRGCRTNSLPRAGRWLHRRATAPTP